MAEVKYGGAELHRRLRIYYALKICTLAMAFFFQILVAKTLDPENYATYAILLAVLIAAERVFSFGIDRVILRFVPPLTSQGDFTGLRWLLQRIGIVRFLSISAMLLGVFLFSRFGFLDQLPAHLLPSTMFAYAAWYVGFALTTDADMMAQSWLAHVQIASVAAFEILARSVAVAFCAIAGYRDVNAVIVVCALTSTLALGVIILLAVRIFSTQDRIRKLAQSSALNKYPCVDVRAVPMFAAAAYVSNLSWLISSPVVVRLIAKSGLDVIAFSAFSFVQALCVSLQRSLPGQLVVPSLEPLLTRYSANAQKARMFAVLSLVFKVELIFSLSFIIVTTLAGRELVTLLSRSAYSAYFAIFPGLMIILLLQTVYRICEIVMSIRLKNKAFLALWPISLLSILLIYLTAARWGLWSVIGIPIGEGLIRISILVAVYHRERIWLAFDLIRSLQLALSTVAVLLIGQLLQSAIGDYLNGSTLAAGCIALWLVIVLALRPLRLIEIEVFSTILPRSLSVVTRIATVFARP